MRDDSQESGSNKATAMLKSGMTKVNQSEMCHEIEAAFELLGKRWTGLIIRVLLSGPKRFRDISQMIPSMSDRMLAERLKELEAAGMLNRSVYPEIPVRVEYGLTQKGAALKSALGEIEKWASIWFQPIDEHSKNPS